jgi:hypothetical protein
VVDTSNALVGCLRPVDKKERKRRSSIFEDSYTEPNGDEATYNASLLRSKCVFWAGSTERASKKALEGVRWTYP